MGLCADERWASSRVDKVFVRKLVATFHLVGSTWGFHLAYGFVKFQYQLYFVTSATSAKPLNKDHVEKFEKWYIKGDDSCFSWF